ncbi:MAG: hypothetical protein ACI8T1_003938 [Verrucomicrobiales bacterium]|jgi:hypothetical protein
MTEHRPPGWFQPVTHREAPEPIIAFRIWALIDVGAAIETQSNKVEL